MDKQLITGNEPVNAIFLDEGLSSNSHVDLGITIRQHYAGLAMQGILADPNYSGKNVAADAVESADALIEALNK